MAKIQRLRRKFNYNKNRKREWKKKKTLPKVKCEILENCWDHKLSHIVNLQKIGLSHDSNVTLRIPTTKELLLKKENVEMPKVEETSEVVKALEELAKPVKKMPKQTLDDSKFCQEMIEKYKNNYNAMARDRRNFYQLTANQIRKKVETYHQING